MVAKGDIILVSSPLSPYAGLIGIVKRVNKKGHKLVVKFHKDKNTIWIIADDVIKLTKHQQVQLEKIGEENALCTIKLKV